MRVLRITRCKELIQYWDFFVRGIEFAAKYLHYEYSFDTYRKILQRLVTTPSAFVAIALDDDNQPLCFAVAYDSTPIAATEKEYDVPFVYHKPYRDEAGVISRDGISGLALLRRDFEHFCRRNRIKRYSMTTTAFNGMAQKCIPRFGFRRSHIVYKREL